MLGGKVEFGGYVPLLGDLCFVQAHVRASEIGAGVLHVRIEKAPIKVEREIIVVGDVTPGGGAGNPVVAHRFPPAPERAGLRAARRRGGIA